MDAFIQQKNTIDSLLASQASFGIIASEKQNLDVLSAAVSLHLILQDSQKNSQVVSKKDPIVEHSFLVGIDQLKKKFSGLTQNLIISFPYREGEIDKVSYNIEGNYLNVNLFGSEQGITFDEKNIKYFRQGSSPSVIFTIGIQDLLEIEGIADATSKIINIDCDPNNSLFGDVVLVDGSSSSLSEAVARFAIDMGFSVEFDVAQNLLDGISYATNNFSSPKTSPLAFEMAGILMQKGAVRKNLKETKNKFQDTSISMLNRQNVDRVSDRTSFSNSTRAFGSAQKINEVIKQMAREEFGQDEVNTPTPAQLNQDSPNVSKPNIPQPDTFPMENSDIITPEIPTEEEAPSDWFTPKVFKSKNSQD